MKAASKEAAFLLSSRPLHCSSNSFSLVLSDNNAHAICTYRCRRVPSIDGLLNKHLTGTIDPVRSQHFPPGQERYRAINEQNSLARHTCQSGSRRSVTRDFFNLQVQKEEAARR